MLARKKIWLGSVAALAAAAFNGSGGLLTKLLLASGLTSDSIAFYKTLVAFLIVTIAVIVRGEWAGLLTYMRSHFKALAAAAFMGIFVLYFFETAAFSHERVSIVAFVLLGSSTLTTFALLSILNRKMISFGNLISIVVALLGLGLMFLESVDHVNFKGGFYAALGGIGYGFFLVMVQKFSLGSGLKMLAGLLFFATIFLFVPLIGSGASPLTQASQFNSIFLSALIPTILGFWCTTKSLELIDSSRVQLIELMEPVFAMIFAVALIGERVSLKEIAGGMLIILSIVGFEKLDAISFSDLRRRKLSKSGASI